MTGGMPWFRRVTLTIAVGVLAGGEVGLAQPGVSLSPSEADVGEGAVTSYEITLDAEPTADVSIDLAAAAGVTFDPPTVTFTDSAGIAPWDVPQSLLVTAVDDSIAQGDRREAIVHAATSEDPGYDGIPVPDFIVDIADDDLAGVVVDESDSGTAVTEGGAGDSLDVSLSSEPLAQVDVVWNPDSQTIATPAGACFVATTDDLPGSGAYAPCTVWDTPQTVLVDAVDDLETEGPHASTIGLEVSSSDGVYDGIAVPPITADVTDDDQPNIVFVLADDLGSEYIGGLGIGAVPPPTPNIDGLIASGKTFTSAWSSPVCTPTRVSLHTGKNAFDTGIGATIPLGDTTRWLALEELLLPELLRDVGYTSAAFGKWHLGLGTGAAEIDPSIPNLSGYDHFEGTEANLTNESYYDFSKITNGVYTSETVYSTTAITDWAVDWITQEAPLDAPWFVYVAYHAPHAPFHDPPADLHTRDLTGAGNPQANPGPYFSAAVEALDTEFGRLLGSLPEDTLVVFASDNGSPKEVVHTPFAPKKAKLTPAEGGVLVPLIVSGPGIAPGTVDDIVQFTDLYATIADLGGVDPSLTAAPGIDSISVAAQIRDATPLAPREFAYTEVFRPLGPPPYERMRRALRDAAGFKLIQYAGFPTGPQGDLLFDLSEDPFEEVNLLGGTLTPEQQQAYDALRAQMLVLTGYADPPIE